MYTSEEKKDAILLIIYYLGVWIFGFIIFIGVWIYAIMTWGFLLGIALGWIPAIIAAYIGGFLWPFLLLIGLLLLAYLTKTT